MFNFASLLGRLHVCIKNLKCQNGTKTKQTLKKKGNCRSEEKRGPLRTLLYEKNALECCFCIKSVYEKIFYANQLGFIIVQYMAFQLAHTHKHKDKHTQKSCTLPNAENQDKKGFWDACHTHFHLGWF